MLMHPTSLPGSYGIGTIGGEAFRFVDWLVSAGMQVCECAARVLLRKPGCYEACAAMCSSVVRCDYTMC